MAERLSPPAYDELRRIGHQPMRRGAPGHWLFTTALVHGAQLQLLGPKG